MVVMAYYFVQWFGVINGLGITALCWLSSMAIVDDRLIRRDTRRYGGSAFYSG